MSQNATDDVYAWQRRGTILVDPTCFDEYNIVSRKVCCRKVQKRRGERWLAALK